MNKDFKYSIYYVFRYILWELLISVFASVCLVGLATVVYVFLRNYFSVQNNLMAYAVLVFCSLYLIAGIYFPTKLALRKTFFKPYKKFRLEPKISKIGAKITLGFLGLKFLVALLIGCIAILGITALGIDLTLEDIDTEIAIPCEIILSYVITYFVLRRLVCKYAEISDEKSEDSEG